MRKITDSTFQRRVAPRTEVRRVLVQTDVALPAAFCSVVHCLMQAPTQCIATGGDCTRAVHAVLSSNVMKTPNVSPKKKDDYATL